MPHCEVGKVTEYDGFKGKIITADNEYMFLISDTKEEIKIGDTVSFRGEMIHDIGRAFFVHKVHDNAEKAGNT